MHAQMQEAHSMRQLELAKSTNIDKLVSEFDRVSLLFDLLYLSFCFVLFVCLFGFFLGGGLVQSLECSFNPFTTRSLPLTSKIVWR